LGDNQQQGLSAEERKGAMYRFFFGGPIRVTVLISFLSCFSIYRSTTSSLLFVRGLSIHKAHCNSGYISRRCSHDDPSRQYAKTTITRAVSIKSQLSSEQKSSSRSWMELMGSTALQTTTSLAEFASRYSRQNTNDILNYTKSANVPVYNINALSPVPNETANENKMNAEKLAVMSTLAKVERDMGLLDDLAADQNHISGLELTMLSLSVLSAALSPVIFDSGVVEVLAPACAAFSGLISVGAEFVGRVAVADGKEIAAVTLQCSAEAEAALANAERSKAVMPLCVGISAAAATFSLLAPVLIEAISASYGISLGTEFVLLAPIVSVLAAAVASLALQETIAFSKRSVGIGNRRFAKSGLVGRTWLSATQQIQSKSQRTSKRFQSFGYSVSPAPIVGIFVPGALSTKAIVVAALAAVQSAFFCAQAENTLARATDAVAIKCRSAAICDTYANQGARSGAILPYTSALGALCAAATAALVELPYGIFVNGIFGALPPAALLVESIIVSSFPALAAFCAAAASVSKARCQVDAEAASQAASAFALEYDDSEQDPVLKPFRGVIKLLLLSALGGWRKLKESKLSTGLIQPLWKRVTSWLNPSND